MLECPELQKAWIVIENAYQSRVRQENVDEFLEGRLLIFAPAPTVRPPSSMCSASGPVVACEHLGVMHS